MRKCILILCALAGLLLVSSCEKVVFKPTPPLVSFGEFVVPLVKANCAECHTSWADSASLYSTLLDEQIIDTALLSNGKLYQMMKTGVPQHLMDKMTTAELDTFIRWMDEGAKEYNTPPPVSFILQVAPLIVTKCTVCHPSWKPAGTLYETWLTGQIINPDNSTGSKLYLMIDDSQSHVPLNTAQRALVKDWLLQGSKNN